MQTLETSLDEIEKIVAASRRRRFFMRDGAWFFLTRREQEHGPYASLAEAQRQLTIYLHKRGIIHFSL